MNTPETIEHSGKTLQRLPDINDAREGDWVMISGKMFPVNFEKRVESLYYYEYKHFIQAAYREKKTEVYKWIDPYEPQGFESREMLEIVNAVIRRTNEALNHKYGSPEALMRKGAEQAIQLSDREWEQVREKIDGGYPAPVFKKICRQAVANCRPKGGVK